MQMQATVSKGFVFTSLTVLKHASATLFLAHLHILLRVVLNFK